MKTTVARRSACESLEGENIFLSIQKVTYTPIEHRHSRIPACSPRGSLMASWKIHENDDFSIITKIAI